MLRAMVDIIISTAIITESPGDSEYRGFKYTYGFLKQNLNNPDMPPEQRKRFREQIEEGIHDLQSAVQNKARKFMFQEKNYGYWHSPEYMRPTEALKKLCSSEVSKLYAMFSGGAHGSYLGLRLLRDYPDDIHPNPRSDKRSQTLAIVGAIRLTLETFRAMDRAMTDGFHEAASDELRQRLLSIRPA